MSNQTNHLFAREVACKSCAVRIVVFHDGRLSIFPANTLCAREQISHQLIFCGHFYSDKPVTNSWRSIRSTSHTLPVTLELLKRSIAGLHFHVAIHGLGCRAFHDDVNRSSVNILVDHISLGVATDEVSDFLFRSSVRDLEDVSTSSEVVAPPMLRDMEETELAMK